MSSRDNVFTVVAGISMGVVLILIFLKGCGIQDRPSPRTVSPPPPCSVEEYDDAVVIQCPDGSEAVVHRAADGVDGEDGTDGVDGAPAEPCGVFKSDEDGATTITCPDGSYAVVKDGEDGADGKVRTVKQELVYEGYVCGRTVVRLGRDWFVVHNGLVPLSETFYKVSNSCKVKVVDNVLISG